MMRKCSVFAFCALVLFACKKKDIELPEDVVCDNTTAITADSVQVALVTATSSKTSEIVKIQDSVVTVVASDGQYEFWGPCLSPDRQKFICFRSINNSTSPDVDDYQHAALWMFNIDGSGGHEIVKLSDLSLSAMGMADWAADGIHLVFAGEKTEITDGQKHWSLFMTDTAGNSFTKMNTRLGYFVHPRFANGSSTLITYSAWPDEAMSGNIDKFRAEIHYANITGSFHLTGETRVTSDLQYDYSPCFSPDNSRICYSKTTSVNAGTAVTLNLYNLSTGANGTLINNSTINENPYWAPDYRIYFSNKPSTACIKSCMSVNPTDVSDVRTYYRGTNKNIFHTNIK